LSLLCEMFGRHHGYVVPYAYGGWGGWGYPYYGGWGGYYGCW